MISNLIINHIVIGTVEIDDMSGILSPKLETYVEGIGYSVRMKSYSYNYDNDSIHAVYVLTDYDDMGNSNQTEYEFNSDEDIIDDWLYWHNLKEVK